MIKPMIVLFLLGALQGLVGWIMVMSGLEDSELLYVSHYKLAIHFILALGLVSYAFWFALELLVKKEQLVQNNASRKLLSWLTGLLILQLIYGAFMAGLKAAPFAVTWPDINGKFFPDGATTGNGIAIFDNPLMVQFIHRGLAYIVTILIFVWWWKAKKFNGSKLYHTIIHVPLLLVLLQVVLGVLTVLNATNRTSLIWLGVTHQCVAMMLLLSFVFLFYVIRKRART